MEQDYVRLANPIAPDKRVMRRNLLNSVMNVVKNNERRVDSLALFEVGPVFISATDLPLEPRRLAMAMCGNRYQSSWDGQKSQPVDFYDLKGIIEALMQALHIQVNFVPASNTVYHPGKCAEVRSGEAILGTFRGITPAGATEL